MAYKQNSTNRLMFIGGLGFEIPNTNLVRVDATSSSTTQVDVYTAPSNTRSIILGISGAVTSGTTAFRIFRKISSTYYLIDTSGSSASGSSNDCLTAKTIILEPGESVGIANVTASTSLNIYMSLLEFPDSFPLKTIEFVPAAGDNTIYTVPLGKTALICDVNNALTLGNSSNPSQIRGLRNGVNLTSEPYFIPNGGSKTTATQVSQRTNVGSGADVQFCYAPFLPSQTSILMNDTSVGTTPIDYFSVYEF